MEGFALVLFLPLLGLCLFGCTQFWRLINHGSIGGRVAGWLFFIPCVLLTLFSLLMVISIFNPPDRHFEYETLPAPTAPDSLTTAPH